MMAIDVSGVLGAQQIAGVKVNPRGLGKARGAGMSGANVGGAIGAAISATRQGKAQQEKAQFASTSHTPSFGRLAFLAVTGDEVALVKLKSGIVTLKPGEVIVRLPRSDVASAELGGGVSPSLTVTLSNGDAWQLEVPRPSKKNAEAVVHALSG
jgi:hypothetical protein